MPETMSIERRKLLAAYGAKLVLTEGARGMAGSVAKAEEIAASAPGSVRPAAAVQEPGEPAHPRDDDRPRDLGRHRRRRRHLRLGRRHRRHHHRRLALHQTDPGQADPLGGGRAGGQPRPHPDARRRSRCSRGRTRSRASARASCPTCWICRSSTSIEQVSNDEAIAYARRLAREEGILSGISCGAAVAVAVRIAKRPENEGKTIVTVLPDSGERYLSSPLFEGVFDAQGFS